jgi:serine protease Do
MVAHQHASFRGGSFLLSARRYGFLRIVGGFFLLVCCLGQPAAASQLWHDPPPGSPPHPLLHQLNEALRGLTAKLLPAVISLRVHSDNASPSLPDNHPPLPDAIPAFSTGSGVIIREDGLALTNYHVVEDSDRIEVLLFDGTHTTAKVLGQDPVGDLALIEIETTAPLPVAPLGSSRALRAGEFVVAMGSPFGFENTITFGIVSAVKRQFLHSGIVGGYIQTDASINVGNSGGPLVNMRGEVVGINVATVGRGELGFAIPIDAIKSVLPQLYTAGEVRRGWLGVQIRPLNAVKAAELGLSPPRGAYVHAVMDDYPADQAGVVAGDVILQFDGREITSPFELQQVVATTPVGKKVVVQVFREQHTRTLELTVGQMPEELK